MATHIVRDCAAEAKGITTGVDPAPFFNGDFLGASCFVELITFRKPLKNQVKNGAGLTRKLYVGMIDHSLTIARNKQAEGRNW